MHNPDAWMDSLDTAAKDIYQGGEASQFYVSVKQICIQSQEPIELPSPGVTAIVGGNNVGKSTLLSQLAHRLVDPRGHWQQPVVLSDLKLSVSTSRADTYQWLRTNAMLYDSGAALTFYRPGAAITMGYTGVSTTYDPFQTSSESLGQLAHFLVNHTTLSQRRLNASGTQRRTSFADPPQSPYHLFELDAERRQELSRLCERAFGHQLTLDPLSGTLAFRVGHVTVPTPPYGEPTPEYLEQMETLPLLSHQGDGMVHMMGLLIPLLAGTYPIMIIDEPEAFLHPPQARVLGQALGELASQNHIQVILGTHDRNILTGLLAAQDVQLSVIRLTRSNTETSARSLSSEDLLPFIQKPELRYTNVLDGLFYQLVVLAEGDRDCRFYAAALDSAHAENRLPIPPHDVLFLPTNGREGMAKLARVLMKFGVPVVASPDLDVLSDKRTLRTLVLALGGEFDSLEADYNSSTAEFEVQPRARSRKDILYAIEGILKEDLDGAYTAQTRERINTALHVPSLWRELKRQGQASMRADRKAVRSLLDGLDVRRIVTVRVGELERFAPDVGIKKGPLWLDAAFKAGAHKSPEAKDHVRRLVRAGGWLC